MRASGFVAAPSPNKRAIKLERQGTYAELSHSVLKPSPNHVVGAFGASPRGGMMFMYLSLKASEFIKENSG